MTERKSKEELRYTTELQLLYSIYGRSNVRSRMGIIKHDLVGERMSTPLYVCEVCSAT